MTTLNLGTSPSVAQQLRELNSETRVLQTALNQAQASVNHAVHLVELNYHRKRKEILRSDEVSARVSNGNGDETKSICP